jgi:5-methyltetrahydropteroyltriglutamate--homocysteine methyltransferase
LREARVKAKAGAISAAQLQEIEDRCIRAAVAKQESLGLEAVTDGEYRRDFWHLDFLRQFKGVDLAPAVGMTFQAEDVPPMAAISGKVRCSGPMMVDHFAFLQSVARGTPKLTIPSPAMLHMRGGRNAISRQAYPDLDQFWADATAAYRQAISHIAAAGCTYLQLDDVSFAYLCDPKVRENFRANGDDPATLPRIYADAIQSPPALGTPRGTRGAPRGHMAAGRGRAPDSASGASSAIWVSRRGRAGTRRRDHASRAGWDERRSILPRVSAPRSA